MRSSWSIQIPNLASQEAKEFFSAAKKQIGVVTSYDLSNEYYSHWWFPPENTGVCTDVIWRAYRDIWKDFKKILWEHHDKFPRLYQDFGDNNINFRRVKNIDTFYKNTAKVLTNEMIPNDTVNLSEWQTGDIVIFQALPPKNLWHIGIIADSRRDDGVPFMIDNHGQWTRISSTPLDWPTKIIWHYRPF